MFWPSGGCGVNFKLNTYWKWVIFAVRLGFVVSGGFVANSVEQSWSPDRNLDPSPTCRKRESPIDESACLYKAQSRETKHTRDVKELQMGG